jgi:hypothetical protein
MTLALWHYGPVDGFGHIEDTVIEEPVDTPHGGST